MVVTGLNPNGTAAAAGLREGDVIMTVDETTIGDFDDLQAAIDGARAAEHETMLFQIRREDSIIFLAVDTWVND
jgi:serine protease Do